MQNKIKLGKYKHFKGNIYEVIAIAENTETKEKLVVYYSLENPEKIWARPLSMFIEEVDKPEYNYKGQRFEFVGD
ncbi:DUF1653 domain-containing protein [Candidatus Pacearchaeota archaeon]|nr:DUF1653 domain-containing protein [Candidatus Pacearchaeota archaeon]